MVATDTWRDNRALLVRLKTDADGRFTWNEAPADAVLTDFLKQGFMDKRRVAIKAGDENVVTVAPPLKVTGAVVDADTGKPIEGGFTFTPGILFEGQTEVTWQAHERSAGNEADGTFEYLVTGSYPQHAIRVEASGGAYPPADSRVFKESEGETISLVFKLKRGTSLTGTLKTPDGKALAGGEIAVCTGQFGAYVINGVINQRENARIVKSDEAGHFNVPPQTGKFLLLVFNYAADAEVTSEQFAKQKGQITIKPWVSVRGTLRIGAALAPAALRMIISRYDTPGGGNVDEEDENYDAMAPAKMDRDRPRVYHDLRATTDKEGRFAFDRVPAGKMVVAQQVQGTANMYGSTQAVMITAKPRQAMDLKLGGTGRALIRKIVTPP